MSVIRGRFDIFHSRHYASNRNLSRQCAFTRHRKQCFAYGIARKEKKLEISSLFESISFYARCSGDVAFN